MPTKRKRLFRFETIVHIERHDIPYIGDTFVDFAHAWHVLGAEPPWCLQNEEFRIVLTAVVRRVANLRKPSQESGRIRDPI